MKILLVCVPVYPDDVTFV